MSLNDTERQPLLSEHRQQLQQNEKNSTAAIEQERKTPWYMVVLGIFLVVFAGLTFTGANVIQKNFPNPGIWSLFLIRGLTQMPVMASHVIWTKTSFIGPKESRRMIFCQGTFGGLLLLFIFVAIQHVPLGNASAIFFCTPVATFIFGHFMLREPLKCYRFMIIVFMMSGVALITRPNFLGFARDNKTTLSTDQRWNLNGSILINQAGKWISNATWELPSENSTGYIKNLDTNMVLGVVNDTTYVTGTRVMEENLGINVGQKWTIGQKFDNDDYFNITNPASGKVLTAKSKDKLTIEDPDSGFDNNEILGYVTCCMVPILSAIVSIWTRQCKKVQASLVMFWFAVGSCFWAIVGSLAFGQMDKVFNLKTDEIGWTMAIVLLGMLGNFSYTMAVKWVSPTKANVFRSFEVILNYLLQIFLEHHAFHYSDILGIFALLMAVFATGFEQEVMRKKLHPWI